MDKMIIPEKVKKRTIAKQEKHFFPVNMQQKTLFFGKMASTVFFLFSNDNRFEGQITWHHNEVSV